MPSNPQTADVTMLIPMEKLKVEKSVLKIKSPTPPKREFKESHKKLFNGLEKSLKIIMEMTATRM